MNGRISADRFYAAIATPMRDDESVDLETLATLIDRYIAKGVEGVYCNGSSGEGLLLSIEERKATVETAVQASGGRVPVIAHIACMSTKDSIGLGQHASHVGADAVSMIPPLFYGYAEEEVLGFYLDVMDEIELPMFIYNIPQFSKTQISDRTFNALLRDERVAGVKFTDHDMFALQELRVAHPEKVLINGFDETYVPARAAGATGAIGTTVGLQTELFLAARRRFDSGDVAGAQAVQQRINAIIRGLVDNDVFPAAKYLSGRDIGSLGDCRRPLRQLSPETKAALDKLGQTLDRFLQETAQEEASARHSA